MEEQQPEMAPEAVCLKAGRDAKFYKQNKSTVEARVLCILGLPHMPH